MKEIVFDCRKAFDIPAPEIETIRFNSDLSRAGQEVKERFARFSLQMRTPSGKQPKNPKDQALQA